MRNHWRYLLVVGCLLLSTACATTATKTGEVRPDVRRYIDSGVILAEKQFGMGCKSPEVTNREIDEARTEGKSFVGRWTVNRCGTVVHYRVTAAPIPDGNTRWGFELEEKDLLRNPLANAPKRKLKVIYEDDLWKCEQTIDGPQRCRCAYRYSRERVSQLSTMFSTRGGRIAALSFFQPLIDTQEGRREVVNYHIAEPTVAVRASRSEGASRNLEWIDLGDETLKQSDANARRFLREIFSQDNVHVAVRSARLHSSEQGRVSPKERSGTVEGEISNSRAVGLAFRSCMGGGF